MIILLIYKKWSNSFTRRFICSNIFKILSSKCVVKGMPQRIARIPGIPRSIGPVGTRVLGPTLFSPDIADCFRRNSILACELGRCTRSLGLLQERDVNSLVRSESDSFCHCACPRSSLHLWDAPGPAGGKLGVRCSTGLVSRSNTAVY